MNKIPAALVTVVSFLSPGTCPAEEISFFMADTDTIVVHEAIMRAHLP
jgi:hypothetical protein